MQLMGIIIRITLSDALSGLRLERNQYRQNLSDMLPEVYWGSSTPVSRCRVSGLFFSNYRICGRCVAHLNPELHWCSSPTPDIILIH